MARKTVTVTEGEEYLLWMLRTMAKPDGAGLQVHAGHGMVQLILPANETGRPDDLVGEGATIDDAYDNLSAALRTPP